jgi:hypothetical protein
MASSMMNEKSEQSPALDARETVSKLEQENPTVMPVQELEELISSSETLSRTLSKGRRVKEPSR